MTLGAPAEIWKLELVNENHRAIAIWQVWDQPSQIEAEELRASGYGLPDNFDHRKTCILSCFNVGRVWEKSKQKEKERQQLNLGKI